MKRDGTYREGSRTYREGSRTCREGSRTCREAQRTCHEAGETSHEGKAPCCEVGETSHEGKAPCCEVGEISHEGKVPCCEAGGTSHEGKTSCCEAGGTSHEGKTSCCEAGETSHEGKAPCCEAGETSHEGKASCCEVGETSPEAELTCYKRVWNLLWNGRGAVMKARLVIALLIILLLGMAGCQTQAPATVLTNRTDSIYIDKLLPYPLPADSASIRALMECDEAGKVVLRWLEMANTKNVQLLFSVDSLGEVTADMKVQPDTVYLPAKETIVTKDVEVPVRVEKELSRWEKLKIEVGGWAIGLLSGFLMMGLGYAGRWMIRNIRADG